MEDSFLGPEISGKYPYQELKEQLGKRKFDILIVFGQGPVKPVLLWEELTPDQQKEWEEFKKDPLHNIEPNFRVIEGSAFLSELEEIDKNPNLKTEEERRQAREIIRNKWQHMGRLALTRWGRENALAAGLALYLGITDKVILSGGKTMPDFAKQSLPEERINSWPSEAELMKDIIVRRFGRLYQEIYRKPIEEAIIIEGDSLNTLANFANSIVKNPSLISPDTSVGLLATDFHIERCQILAELFSIATDPNANVKAQTILKQRAEITNKPIYIKIQSWLTNIDENPDLQLRHKNEERWTRGLTDPKFTAYFLQYFGRFNTPETIPVLQNLFENVLKHPERIDEVRRLFQTVGMNFDEFTKTDLLDLAQNQPEKFNELIKRLGEIPREFPPEKK